MTQTVDTLIHARWIVPVNPENIIHEDHCLAIRQGKIAGILPSSQVDAHFVAEENLHLSSHVLIPGLINTHTHSPMSLFRGLADDLPLMDWLNQHIWPAEGRWVGEEFVADGSRLAIAEMIRGGTTCFNDMYFFPEVTAQAAQSAHIRATLGMIVIDFPSSWADSTDTYFSKGLELHDQYREHPLIRTAFAPHAPYSVSDDPLKRLLTLSQELDIPVHMHIHETADEIRLGMESHGKRPLQRLAELGMLTPSLMGVHMTQLEPDEICLFAESGSHVVHCPESNLKLASGFCPVSRLAENGINVALGTDGAASNNDLDMFSEMRTAALLAKGVSGDASSLPAATALKMATLNGAKALGMESVTGSLEPGKAADITAVNLDCLQTEPVYSPVSQLVYATHANQVSDVWINGRQVLQSRQLTTLDRQEIIHKARYWRDKIRENT